ncbi:MAG: hypothetical protein FWE15_24790, partial [Actinomycetia bacterium]|nr:hypothetical protein [Actinomycetes bacterium]
AIYCPATSELTQPVYTAVLPAPVDLTSGYGDVINNVMRFWAGFASPQYYAKWANHQSEVTFAFTLRDAAGKTVSASTHQKVAHSSNAAKPLWQAVSVRMPVANVDFDYSQVTRYSVRAYNYVKGSASYLKDSQFFLDSLYAESPSSFILGGSGGITRGSIYRLNGVEGSVHTPISVEATQQPSSDESTVTFNGTGGTWWLAPAGVTMLDTATAIGTGGPGGATATGNPPGGGGGAEWAQESGIPVTQGHEYEVIAHPGEQPLGTAAQDTAAWTKCGKYESQLPTTDVQVPFTAAVPAGNTIFCQVCMSTPTGRTVGVSDSVNGAYTYLADAIARDGTLTAIYARFNCAAVTTAATVTVTCSTPVSDIVVLLGYKPGYLSAMPSGAFAGTGAGMLANSGGWLNGNAVTTSLTGWTGGPDTTLTMADVNDPVMIDYAAEDFETGTPDAPVTAGTSSFDTVTAGPGASAVYAAADPGDPADPGQYAQVGTGDGMAPVLMAWDSPAGTTVQDFRLLARFPALPAASDVSIARIADEAGAVLADVRLRADGYLAAAGPDGELAVTGSPVPLGTWLAVEAALTLDPAAGTASLAVYYDPAGTGPDDSAAATGLALPGTPAAYEFGAAPVPQDWAASVELTVADAPWGMEVLAFAPDGTAVSGTPFGTASPAGPASSWTIAPDAGAQIPAGAAGIVQVTTAGPAGITVTDTQGNAWTPAVAGPTGDGAAWCSVLTAGDCAALADGDEITVTADSPVTAVCSSAYGMTGLGGYLSAFTGSGAGPDASATGTVTTGQPPALVAVAFSQADGPGLPDGFTQIGAEAANGMYAGVSAGQVPVPDGAAWDYAADEITVTAGLPPSSSADAGAAAQPFSPVMFAAGDSETAAPSFTGGLIPVTGSLWYLPKLYAYLPGTDGTDTTVTVTMQWLDSDENEISASTATSAGWPLDTWTWNFSPAGAPAQASADAAWCQLTAALGAGTGTGVPSLAVGVLGLVPARRPEGAYLAITANNVGLHPAAPPGWTRVDSADDETGGTLALDTFILPGVTGEGTVFGLGTAFGAPVPSGWCASLVYVSSAAWYARFAGDGGRFVLAHGGMSGNGRGASQGAYGGQGSSAARSSPGGAGANGSGSTGGGGGGSGGSGELTPGASEIGTWIDDTDPAFGWQTDVIPPQLISAGIPSSRAPVNAGNGVYTYGAAITQFGIQNLATECLLVVVVPDKAAPNSDGSGIDITLADTKGNTYTYVQKALLSNRRAAQVFYAHASNQPKGANLKPLAVGDNVYAAKTSYPNTHYQVFVYALHGIDGMLGKTGGSNGTGTQAGSFTGTSGTVTVSGYNDAYPGHYVFTICDAASRAPTAMAPRQNPGAGTFDFSKTLWSTTAWSDKNTIVQAFFKGPDTWASTSFSFTRPDKAQVGVVALTLKMSRAGSPGYRASTGPGGWWTTTTSAPSHSGTNHYTRASNPGAVVNWNGPHLQLMGQAGPGCGQMLVSLDGSTYQVVDCYA